MPFAVFRAADRRLWATLAAAAATLCPVSSSFANAPSAAPPAPAAPSYQVIRLGDGQLTCEALVTEANALQQEVTEEGMAMAKKAMRTQESGSAAGSAVMSTLTGMLPIGGDIVQGAGSDVQRAATQKAEEHAMDGAALLQPKMARVEHLQKLAEDKHC